jgi:hypothetical protein
MVFESSITITFTPARLAVSLKVEPLLSGPARVGGMRAACAGAGAHSKRVQKPEAIRDSWVRPII